MKLCYRTSGRDGILCHEWSRSRGTAKVKARWPGTLPEGFQPLRIKPRGHKSVGRREVREGQAAS